jgi:hypothetical protein
MRVVLTAVAAGVAALAVIGPVAAGGAVVLNELMADPARDWSPTDGDAVYDSVDDEWVEVYNTGPGAVDMTGWRLSDAAAEWRYQFQGVLGAGARIVVYGNESYAWEEANGFPKGGLSLNNSGDTVTLTAADLVTVVDQVTYATNQVLDDRAYGRLPDGGQDWQIFDGLNPTSPPTTGLLPTPGMPNTASPVEPASWGSIKALFE